jgi:hypothetical protein
MIDIVFNRLGFHQGSVIEGGPFEIFILSLLIEALQNGIMNKVFQVLEINLFGSFGLEDTLPPHINIFWFHGDGSRLVLRCEDSLSFFIWKGIGLHNDDEFAFGDLLIALALTGVQEDVHERYHVKIRAKFIIKTNYSLL